MMTCPPFENLIVYLAGEADKVVSQAIGAHLESRCPRCEADRAWYAQVKTITASDATVEPPPWVLQRALKLFKTSSAPGRLVERVGRLVATLVFDSFATTSFAGARSSAAAERQLLYRADSYSIDLQLAEINETHRELTGQILREGEFRFASVAGIELKLIREAQMIFATNTNQFGEFMIASIERGNYDLHLQTNEISITVVGLPVA